MDTRDRQCGDLRLRARPGHCLPAWPAGGQRRHQRLRSESDELTYGVSDRIGDVR